MTLLILELRVPNLRPSAPNVEVTPALVALWPKFVSYFVTFVSLGVFWIGHHIMYHAIRWADRTLLWLNIFFFMFSHYFHFDQYPERFSACLHRAVLFWNQSRHRRLAAILSMDLCKLAAGYARGFYQRRISFDG